MTEKQAFEAGYSVGRDGQGWHIQRRETRNGRLTNFVLRRDYPTRKAALADLYSEMTHPDGVLRPEHMQAVHDEITAKTLAKGRSSINYQQPKI
jgi:hypothetical protein